MLSSVSSPNDKVRRADLRLMGTTMKSPLSRVITILRARPIDWTLVCIEMEAMKSRLGVFDLCDLIGANPINKTTDVSPDVVTRCFRWYANKCFLYSSTLQTRIINMIHIYHMLLVFDCRHLAQEYKLYDSILFMIGKQINTVSI